MDIISNPARSEWNPLCERPSSENPKVRDIVESILKRVLTEGDKALEELSLEIDKRPLGSVAVTAQEVKEACDSVSRDVKEAVEQAYSNIYKFHAAQKPSSVQVETMPGVKCYRKPVAINKVGLYIPGGTAPLFSTVLMLAIPAQIAGCKEVILCTPTRPDGKISPEVLYCAHRCGIEKIYKAGGAQAIAAMAYGTQTIPCVDKIFGPGNQFVTTAKQMLSGKKVAIDMPAGPSEVMVIADDLSNPDFVASDLLSQAEHGSDSQVVLLCRSSLFASKVQECVNTQKALLDRDTFVDNSLSKSHMIIFDNEDEIVDFANRYAPEHLIISTSKPWDYADRIYAAGSVFIGQYTPESAGDYASGTNHTLPTCAWARSFSGVGLDSFLRYMTLQEISREGIRALAPTIINMAEAEGLQAHANAARIRVNEK